MIWNANHVLEQALSPDTPGVPRKMIKHCKGIILLSVVSTIEMASRISNHISYSFISIIL